MTHPQLFCLKMISVVEICGNDASTILHNLTTQAVKGLEAGDTVETFVTNVKGKIVGHVMVQQDEKVIRLLGAHGQSDEIASHIDRYIIREDAEVSIVDDRYSGIVVGSDIAERLIQLYSEATSDSSVGETVQNRSRTVNLVIDDQQIRAIPVPWLKDQPILLLVPRKRLTQLCESIAKESSVTMAMEQHFHQERTLHGFPWFGIDLNENNLPQEADRDAETISFTKGCYLGQETIARLDAMGQVQKKLVRWEISNGTPQSGTTVESDGKTVGRLTSVAVTPKGVFAIGPARRSHFEPGSVAVVTASPENTTETKETSGTATVL